MTNTTLPYDTAPAPVAAKALRRKLIPVLIGAALGLFLLVGGGRQLVGTEDAETATTPAEPAPGRLYELSLDTYRQALETRIAAICAQVAGAGEVRVIVSLEGGFEYVYAVDEKSLSSGSSRVYVTVGSGSGKSLVFLTEKAPALRGIGVVCTGGSHATVQREITSLLCSTFGIGSNCVFVTAKG